MVRHGKHMVASFYRSEGHKEGTVTVQGRNVLSVQPYLFKTQQLHPAKQLWTSIKHTTCVLLLLLLLLLQDLWPPGLWTKQAARLHQIGVKLLLIMLHNARRKLRMLMCTLGRSVTPVSLIEIALSRSR